MNRVFLGLVSSLAFATSAPALAANSPSDVSFTDFRADLQFVYAKATNVSGREVGSFKAYFHVFNGQRKFTETVEAEFTGHLKPGGSTIIKGPIYKSWQPGPPIVNFKEVKFFL